MAAKSVIKFVLGQFAKRSARNTGIPKILNANDSIVQSNARSIENILKNHGYNPSNMSSDDILNAMNYHKAMMDQRMTQEFKRLDLSKGVDDLAKKPPFQGFKPTIVEEGTTGIENINNQFKKALEKRKEMFPGSTDKTLLRDSPEAIAKIKAENKAALERLKKKKTDNPEDMASGGIAGQLHLNRPGYYKGRVVTGISNFLKRLKGKEKTNAETMAEIKELIYKNAPPPRIDMKKLMEGDKPIKLYSGQTKRQSNTMKFFKEDAEFFKTTPEKIAKDRFKDQWFTPYPDYAASFYDPSNLTSTMRTVKLTPKEISLAKRYVEKMNKLKSISVARMEGLPHAPNINLTLDDNTVIIPRIKLKKLKEEGRLKTDYRIPEKIKAKFGIIPKKGIQYKQGGRIGYAEGTKKPGEEQYSPTKDKAWMQTMPEIDPYKKFFRRKNKLMKFKDSKGLAEILGV